MTETISDTHPDIISRIPTRAMPGAHPPGKETRSSNHPAPPKRSHHLVSNPRRRPPISEEQRRKLSAAQKAYVARDPRWAEHRRKLAGAQIARRMSLTPEEFDMVVKMRAKGRTLSYIEAEIGVCHNVIRRELAERGHSTAPVRSQKRAKRGTGFWRSFD